MFFFNPSKYIDGLIYVSNFARTLHHKYMPILKDKPNIILHNFTTQYVRDEQEIKDKYYLFFGRLSSEKGLRTLTNAFKSRHDLKLKIVGAGPMEKELKTIKQSDSIQLLGYKSGDELRKLIKEAYFTLVPSEWYENNPMSIIESYSHGVPVIASNMGGIPEIVKHKETGFIFKGGDTQDLLDKINKAENLSELDYMTMTKNVLKYSHESFNPSIYVEKLLDFYNKVSLTYKKS